MVVGGFHNKISRQQSHTRHLKPSVFVVKSGGDDAQFARFPHRFPHSRVGNDLAVLIVRRLFIHLPKNRIQLLVGEILHAIQKNINSIQVILLISGVLEEPFQLMHLL